jgi:hypothetical protein
LCNNLVSDSIFLVLCSLLHTLHSKQRLHFIPKTENSVHCQAGAPCPKINLTLCRSNLNPYCMGRKAAFFSVGI